MHFVDLELNSLSMKLTMKIISCLSILFLAAMLYLMAIFLYSNKNVTLNDSAAAVSMMRRTKKYLQETFGSEMCHHDKRNRTLRLTYTAPMINASCTKLFAGDSSEVRRVRSLEDAWTNSVSDVEFLENIAICQEIVPSFLNNFYTSEKEKRFPLGYVLVVSYKENSIQQYIRLLRFMYRPQNVYCLHIDKKSPKIWTKYITAFASCFPNIIIARDPVDVVYASGKILSAHLNCLKELILSKQPWKYAIDLHGTELPLATNRDIVEALMPLNGLNAIVQGSSKQDVLQHNPESINAHKMTYKAVLVEGKGMKLSKEVLGQTPYNMTLYKSADSPNSALSRDFVQFILIDQRAIALAQYLQDVLSAVEFYFNTLNSLEDAPGGKKDHEKIKTRIPTISRRNWKETTSCHEQYFVHNICIVSVGDLKWLKQLSHKVFFVNKYLITYDHVVMDCMEEYLLQKNIQEYVKDCELGLN